MRKSRSGQIALALAASALAQIGLADNTPVNVESIKLEEITVTSRKERESLQEVPLAITALSADALEKSNTHQIRDIATLTPGLTINGDGSERAQQPAIRGLSFTGDNNQEGNVAVMLDGIYISNPGAMSLGLMDFERVEVIKGPQSALYGANAFAGAINYVSKAPPKQFEGRVQLKAGTFNSTAAQASFGGPLVGDVLTFRAAFGYDRADGSYKDEVNGNRLGGQKKSDASLLLRATPSDRSTIDLGLYVGDDRFGQPMQVSFPTNCARNAAGAYTFYCGELPSTKSLLPLVAPSFVPADASGNDRQVKNARIKGAFEFESFKLEVTGGYFDVKSRAFAELFGVRDGLVFNLVGTPAGTVKLPGFSGGELSNKDHSAEVRFSSNNNGPLHWSAGAYYFKSNQHNFTDIAFNRDPIPAGRTIVCPSNFACLWLSPGATQLSPRGEAVVSNKQTAVFASLGYDITDQLSAGAEVRSTDEKKFANQLWQITAPGTDPDGPNGQSASFKYTNPRFTLNYKITPDNMLYGSVAKGTKSGGFNSRALDVAELAYQPENNWTYEIGLKNTLFDRRVRLNVAVFSVDWKNLQILVPSNTAVIGSVTKNFGSVKATGGEAEIAARIASGVSISAGLAYTNPKFGSDTYDFSNVATCKLIPTCLPSIVTVALPVGNREAVSLNGLQRVLASKWQYTAGLDVNQPLVGNWVWFGVANYKYESKQFTDVDNFRWTPERNTLTLQAGVDNGPLRIAAWAENALNDLTPFGASGGQAITRYNDLTRVPKMSVPPKRRVGVAVNYKF